MADRCEHSADVIVSPTCITDYYKTRKSPHKGSKTNKNSQVNTSSVYLTPESSPAKEQSSVVKTDDAGLSVVSQTLESQLTETHVCCASPQNGFVFDNDVVVPDEGNNMRNYVPENGICDGAINGITLTTEEIADNSQDDQVVGDTTPIEEFGTPVLSHSVKAYNIQKKNTTSGKLSAQSAEPASISSPSLPRPKVRKGAQPKKNPQTPADVPSTKSSQMPPKPGRRKKKETVPIQNSTITDFFPVRRSGRQTKKEIEKQKQHLLETLISSNCEDGLEVEHFDGKGRGIIATKDFDKGDFVVEYAGELIDITAAKERENKYSETPEVGCYMYYFVHSDKHYCVDATAESGRLGRLINHSRDGNCTTRVVPLQDRPRLILIATRAIKAGEELSYDYGDRRKSSVEAHPWLKL